MGMFYFCDWATMYYGHMGGPPDNHGELSLNCAMREFAVCMENVHGYTVGHVRRNIPPISCCMARPYPQCVVIGSRQYSRDLP